MKNNNYEDYFSNNIQYSEILTIPVFRERNRYFHQERDSSIIYHSKLTMKIDPIDGIIADNKKDFSNTNGKSQTTFRFISSSPEYYPSQCCEALHASNAVYLSTILQFFFFICIGILYCMLEEKNYVASIAVFRPALIFFGIVNLIGIFCALIGVFREKNILLQIQITILTGLITFADCFALGLIFIMAIGNRSKTTSSIPGKLVNVDKFEVLLGPFWIYICAITLHMCAAAMMCFNGVNKKFATYLEDKNKYKKLSNNNGIENIQVLKITPPDENV